MFYSEKERHPGYTGQTMGAPRGNPGGAPMLTNLQMEKDGDPWCPGVPPARIDYPLGRYKFSCLGAYETTDLKDLV